MIKPVCTHCSTRESVCVLSAIMPTEHESGGQSTIKLAHLCNECLGSLLNHEWVLNRPSDALALKDILNTFDR